MTQPLPPRPAPPTPAAALPAAVDTAPPAAATPAPPSAGATPGAPRPPVRQSALPDTVEGMDAAVRRLSWPIIVENLFQTFLETLNVALIARISAVALAGV